ncbi:hypothetical protein [Nocardia terpenica]|uniref:Uncharacterized protein n=1 Tax=Nocardia terpenica TaxID=455432 RepID=A0A6G9Z936_9NOCA|nr:hypothetical protein [Nocardia terpenica]QIS22119.1 hypothetical protein F6W96_31010 [Nocardia terpenica]
MACLQVEAVVGVDGRDRCAGLGGIEHVGRLCARTHAVFHRPLGGGETSTALLFGAQLVELVVEVGRVCGEGVVDVGGVVTVSGAGPKIWARVSVLANCWFTSRMCWASSVSVSIRIGSVSTGSGTWSAAVSPDRWCWTQVSMVARSGGGGFKSS